MCSKGQKRSSAATLSFQTIKSWFVPAKDCAVSSSLIRACYCKKRMEVASLQKEYDEINVRLSVLYEGADSIMAKKEDLFLLKSTLDEMNDVHFSMQHLSVKAIGIERAFRLPSDFDRKPNIP